MIPFVMQILVPGKAPVLVRQHLESGEYTLFCHYSRSNERFVAWSNITALSSFKRFVNYRCTWQKNQSRPSEPFRVFNSFPSARECRSTKYSPLKTDLFAFNSSCWSSRPDLKLRKLRLRWCNLRTPQAVEVVAGPGDLNAAIIARFDQLLREPYRSFFFLSNKHVETIFAAFLRSLPSIKYRRECLRMADGGTVALDWPISGEDRELWNSKPSDGAAVLILLPGLTGGSGDTYVRHLLLRARMLGWNTVVFNSRGCAKSPVTTPQFYSASFTEDLRQVVHHVYRCFPKSRLYAVGWSLGANILVRYVGQEGKNCSLAAAVSLCNPFDLMIADEEFRKGFNNVYDRSLAKGLRNILKRHVSLFEEIGGDYNIKKAMGARTVRDFDDGLTRVSFGYNSVDDYYMDASSSQLIGDVKIPLLCIQANNDPIAPSRGIPRSEIQKNPYCLLLVTPTGGHLGWVAGEDAPYGAPWTDSLTMCYLQCIESMQILQKTRNQVEMITKTNSHACSCT